MTRSEQLSWSCVLLLASVLAATAAHRALRQPRSATPAVTAAGDLGLPYSEGQTELVTRSVIGPSAAPISPDAYASPAEAPAPLAPPPPAIAPAPVPIIEERGNDGRREPREPSAVLERGGPNGAPQIDAGPGILRARRLVGREPERRPEQELEQRRRVDERPERDGRSAGASRVGPSLGATGGGRRTVGHTGHGGKRRQ